jgi:DNA-binding IscR family transcriptional regulator
VPVSKADEFLNLMLRIALLEYLATRGNQGAACLNRPEADVTQFDILRFWDDTDAIKRFAGDDFSMARRKTKPLQIESPIYREMSNVDQLQQDISSIIMTSWDNDNDRKECGFRGCLQKGNGRQ